MEQESVSIPRIIEKIINIEKLPFYGEVEILLYFLGGLEEVYERRNCRLVKRLHDIRDLTWWDFCAKYEIYNVYNKEFIDTLADEIRKLDASPIVEICAGSGKLSYHLRERGINIVATDDYSWGFSKEGLVEKLSHIEALKRYKPEVVVGAWLPPDQPEIGVDILSFPSVKYFIDIGEGFGGASWRADGIPEHIRKDWNITYLENVEKYTICRTDSPGKIYHSCVALFSRKDAHSIQDCSR